MPVAFRQSNAVGSGASPRAVTLDTLDVRQGSTLVALMFWASASETLSLADDRGNAWANIAGPQTGAGVLAGYRIQIWEAQNAAAGSTTVTATSSGGADIGIAVHEYTGLGVRSGSSYINDTNDPATMSGFVVSANPATLVAMCAPASFVVSAGSSFTERENLDFSQCSTADRIGVLPGTYSVTFDLSTSEASIIGMVAFEEAPLDYSTLEAFRKRVPMPMLTVPDQDKIMRIQGRGYA